MRQARSDARPMPLFMPASVTPRPQSVARTADFLVRLSFDGSGPRRPPRRTRPGRRTDVLRPQLDVSIRLRRSDRERRASAGADPGRSGTELVRSHRARARSCMRRRTSRERLRLCPSRRALEPRERASVPRARGIHQRARARRAPVDGRAASTAAADAAGRADQLLHALRRQLLPELGPGGARDRLVHQRPAEVVHPGARAPGACRPGRASPTTPGCS